MLSAVRVASGALAHDTRAVRLARQALVIALGAVACGPSYQAVYECDVRFEHCYALDEGKVSMDAKKACWREWLKGYTYGQSGDRIEYAAARFSELSLDPTLPTVEARDTRPGRRAVAPVPTNAFAPPPKISEHALADSAAPQAPIEVVQVVLHAPGSECATACADRWKTCHESCKDGVCEVCDKTYRSCVPACFEHAP
jgi:hypothetical protein